MERLVLRGAVIELCCHIWASSIDGRERGLRDRRLGQREPRPSEGTGLSVRKLVKETCPRAGCLRRRSTVHPHRCSSPARSGGMDARGQGRSWLILTVSSSGLALVSLGSARHKHEFPVPGAPAGRLGGRRAAADRLISYRIGDDEPALPRTGIHKSRLITRRRLRDIVCGHGSELNVGKAKS